MSDLVKESKELLEILRTAPKTIRTNKLSYDDTWNDWDNEEDEEDKLGAFRSDDEIGFFFQTVKAIQQALNQFANRK